MHKILLILLTCLISQFAFTQVTQEEKIHQQIQDQQQAETSELMRMMEKGVELMESENYEEANITFKKVLKAAKVIPTDLCFHFGKNSYYQGKYRQSIDWLNKYIELKGTKGQFYNECAAYLKKANEAFVTVRQEERKEAKAILTSSYDIDCGPSGKVVCPVCKGKGVIITRGSFGDNYKACPYSDDRGHLTCDEYNKLLRGELEPKL